MFHALIHQLALMEHLLSAASRPSWSQRSRSHTSLSSSAKWSLGSSPGRAAVGLKHPGQGGWAAVSLERGREWSSGRTVSVPSLDALQGGGTTRGKKRQKAGKVPIGQARPRLGVCVPALVTARKSPCKGKVPKRRTCSLPLRHVSSPFLWPAPLPLFLLPSP